MRQIIINTANVGIIGLVEGISILLKYDPNSDIAAFHDTIYFCGCEEISKEDIELLDELGWRFDSSIDSWRLNV